MGSYWVTTRVQKSQENVYLETVLDVYLSSLYCKQWPPAASTPGARPDGPPGARLASLAANYFPYIGRAMYISKTIVIWYDADKRLYRYRRLAPIYNPMNRALSFLFGVHTSLHAPAARGVRTYGNTYVDCVRWNRRTSVSMHRVISRSSPHGMTLPVRQ